MGHGIVSLTGKTGSLSHPMRLGYGSRLAHILSGEMMISHLLGALLWLRVAVLKIGLADCRPRGFFGRRDRGSHLGILRVDGIQDLRLRLGVSGRRRTARRRSRRRPARRSRT